MRAINGGVSGIVRNKPDMTMILAERLHCGLIVEQCRHNIPVLCGVLLAYHHKIAVANGCVDHGIAVHLKHEQISGTGESFGQSHHIIHMLFSGDGHSRGDAPHQRNIS